jgi:26S proteasome regulatory subunit N11
MMTGMEPRQTTSNVGHITKPSIVALTHGLNKYYYSIVINYRKNEFEQKMLLNLNKPSWSGSLKLSDYSDQHVENVEALKNLSKLTEQYEKWIREETKKTREEFVVSSVGKMNPGTHIRNQIEENINTNVMDCLSTMMNTVVF